MFHTCHAVDCEIPVKPEMLMCRRHWFTVPPKLRSRVWATYQVGQCDLGSDVDVTRAYCEAARAAVIAVAKSEGKTIDPQHPKILLYDMLQTAEDKLSEQPNP